MHVDESVTEILNEQRAWLYDMDAAGLSEDEMAERLEEALGCSWLDARETVTRYRCGL